MNNIIRYLRAFQSAHYGVVTGDREDPLFQELQKAIFVLEAVQEKDMDWLEELVLSNG